MWIIVGVIAGIVLTVLYFSSGLPWRAQGRDISNINIRSFRKLADYSDCIRNSFWAIDNQYVLASNKKLSTKPPYTWCLGTLPDGSLFRYVLYGTSATDRLCTAEDYYLSSGSSVKERNRVLLKANIKCRDETARRLFEQILLNEPDYSGYFAREYQGHRIVPLFPYFSLI